MAMTAAEGIGWTVLICGAAFCLMAQAHASQPSFASPISSLTVARGRDATMKCAVDNLGSYRVAWIHVDRQTLLSIHTHVITRNKRVSVSHHDFRAWFLHLKNAQLEDSGYYMCQVNTQPMISAVGYLEVVVPPEFVSDVVNRNISVAENANITLSCRATGNPLPKIKWKREDGQPIIVGNEKMKHYDGEELSLFKVSRASMGAYLCIATNGVPPAISRRMNIDITFPPMIWIPHQLVGAAEGSSAALECHTEAHPAATNFWVRSDHVVGGSDGRFEARQVANGYKVHMRLQVKRVAADDFGVYRCVSKNALGETEGSVSLYKIKATSVLNRNVPQTSTSADQTMRIPELKEDDIFRKIGIQDDLSFEEEMDISLSRDADSSKSPVLQTTVEIYLLFLLSLVL